jgi:histone H3/H4
MPLIVVKSQIAGVVKKINEEKGYRVDNITSDFAPALDRKVRSMIEQAVRRAHENNRRTLMGRDV